MDFFVVLKCPRISETIAFEIIFLGNSNFWGVQRHEVVVRVLVPSPHSLSLGGNIEIYRYRS